MAIRSMNWTPSGLYGLTATTSQPLRSELVVEVLYDQVTAGRFRHGTKLLRRRPDKAPRQCTMDQLAPPLTPHQLKQLVGD